jgi:excisionase family DNA binding protein
MEREVLTVEEVAKRLGLGRNSAYEGVARGEIPSIRVGRRILVPRVAIDRMLAQAGSDKAVTPPRS